MRESVRRSALVLLTVTTGIGFLPVVMAAADPAVASRDGIWIAVAPGAVAASGKAQATRWVKPTVFSLFTLNRQPLMDTLRRAPKELAARAARAGTVMSLPMPDGTFARFRVVESPVMSPKLAAKFPQIKTYLGQGLDDPTATARLDWTPKGFHAQVLAPGGAFYIDPYWKDDIGTYASYYKRDYINAAKPFTCSTRPGVARQPQVAAARGSSGSGENLRTYRLACAATGEYTQFHGGTVADGMAAIVTAINRVTGIYTVDFAIRMMLVANNDLLVYTNPATDPYSNSNGFTMLGENQSNITAVIGSGNYDIGHVFSTGGGGVAGLGVVCWDSTKAWGVTGLSSPIGDPFYVDYVSHEMGHQFGGNHTFNGVNGSCCCGNRHGLTAYEPGSGATIMAYAGICGADNLQSNSDPYFQAISFDEIRDYVTTDFGSTCPLVAPTGNGIPTVNAGANYTIPQSTPFVLTASADDPNDDPLSYCWEEMDRGAAAPLSAPDNGSIPLFRSFNPTTASSRTFPRLSYILSGDTSDVEKLPTTSRTMTFRVTVRDNRAAGGGVDFDQMQVTVNAASGPFRITAPTRTMVAGADQTVLWDVAGTNALPVDVSHVNILLSTDGGETFPIVLASNTPNDGSEAVPIPDISIVSARIKIEAVGNVFFDITDANLLIGTCEAANAPQEADIVVSKNRFISFTAGSPGRNEAVRLTFVDLPPPHDVFNGMAMWVGQPDDVSENGGSVEPIPGFDNFKAATLGCDPTFTDWSTLGTVHVYHRNIVPGGFYELQVIGEACDMGAIGNFSFALEAATARWGDTVGDCATAPCSPPDGSITMIDVVAIIGSFVSDPDSIPKIRADLEPATPDLLVSIADAVQVIQAFAGVPYSFSPGPPPCGG